MKTRLGFVSNSSSSSFIIYAHQVPSGLVNKILKPDYTNLKNIKDKWSIFLDRKQVR